MGFKSVMGKVGKAALGGVIGSAGGALASKMGGIGGGIIGGAMRGIADKVSGGGSSSAAPVSRTPMGNDLPDQGGITGTLGRGTNVKDAMMSRFASPSEKAPSTRSAVKRPVSRALGRR